MQQNFIICITKGRRSSARALIAPTFSHLKPRQWIATMPDVLHNGKDSRVGGSDFYGSTNLKEALWLEN